MIFAYNFIKFNSPHEIESINYFFTLLLKAQIFKAPKNGSVST